MSTALVVKPDAPEAALIERVLLHGDLRQLSPAQKVSYYKAVCESVGLNPLTQPFQYLVLNGKEILYATRGATEQLRQVHAVSVQITGREVVEDCYIVTARATLPNNRQDENIGAVPIAGLKGESRANAMMKAETKAKRRVTLAICGLGMLDETEVQSIQSEVPEGHFVDAPRLPEKPEKPVAVTVGNHGQLIPTVVLTKVPDAFKDMPASDVAMVSGSYVKEGPDLGADLPAGALRILDVGPGKASAEAEITFHRNAGDSGRASLLTWKTEVVALARELKEKGEPCFVGLKRSTSGNWRIEEIVRIPQGYSPDEMEPPF